MEEVDLSTITPEELASLDPPRRAKLKTAIQRQLITEKLKLGPLQPPSETAGKMPMAPGQLPPTADTLSPKESLFQWSPNSGGMYAAKGGFMSGPPNPKDTLTQGLGASLGAMTGGPLGMAAGATAKTIPDLASMAAGGVVGGLANKVSPAKNLILRLLQGGSEGIAQGEAARQARNAVIKEPKDKTEPSITNLLTSLGLGAVGKQLQNTATTAGVQAKLAKVGEMHQNDAQNSKLALEENLNVQQQLNKQVNEARRNASIASNAVEAKTIPQGVDPNAGKLKIGKNVYTTDKSADVDLANAAAEAAKIKIASFTEKKKTLQTAKDELANAVAEAGNNKESGVTLKRRFQESEVEYKKILDQLKVPEGSAVRQLPGDYLMYTGSKILTSSAQVAWPLAVIGHILKASTSQKERTISQLAEHLAKKSMTAQEWSEITKLIPVAVNEMDKYKKKSSAPSQ